MNHRKKLRCIILGDENIGTTKLFNNLVGIEKPMYYQPTIGVDLGIIEFEYKNLNIPMILYDCSGNYMYNTIIENYFFESDIFILLYDEQKLRSFRYIEKSKIKYFEP